MAEQRENKGLQLSAKSVIIAVSVLLALMIATYVLTLVIPGGEYSYLEDGRTIDPNSYRSVEGGIAFWKWLLSPFLVLAADGSATIIAVIIFMFVIGGIFNSMGEAGIMNYMLDKIVHRFAGKRYTLMYVTAFFFMAMGSLVGSFEECVPMLPIVVGVAIRLGWDSLTGMGMCTLAVGCGFACALTNPFTVGVAQGLAGLPMFSGMWLRAVTFVLIYIMLVFFLRTHAKRVEKPAEELETGSFSKDPRKDKALALFLGILGVGIAIVLSSSFLTFLQDYTMIIVALMFLAGGISAVLATGAGAGQLFGSLLRGIKAIAPSIVLILMAASIKYTMVEGKIMHSVLHMAVDAASGMSGFGVVMFIYLIALALNFFISSGSAKAFLLIPLLVPLASMFGISAQLTVLAYVFGDGFSNVFYPTNPVLLMSCGIADVSYPSWVKYTWLYQLCIFILTSALLYLGMAVAY